MFNIVRSRKRFPTIVAVMFLASLAGFGFTGRTQAQPDEVPVATDGVAAELEDVFQRYRRVFFDAMVTGDASLFPTVFINSPDAALTHEERQLIDKHRDAVQVQLHDVQSELPTNDPQQAGYDGYLSAQVALIIELDVWADDWEEVVDAASKQKRTPNPLSLPEGSQPYDRRTAEDWVDDVPVTLLNVQAGNQVATADIVFVEEELAADALAHGTQVRHVTFVNVGGTWFIADQRWSSGG